MKPIEKPVEKTLLKQELCRDTFLRKSNKGDNELYIVNNQNAPNTLIEVGRLREISFRMGGGGTGESIDLDEFDLNPNSYQQLIVWDPEEEEIVGGYRFILGSNALKDDGTLALATTELFDINSSFVNLYLHQMIELGRSFVQPKYQPGSNNRNGLFSMDNLWDGLGAISVDYPQTNYFFGKITMYSHFNQEARDLILSFMQHYFPPLGDYVNPKKGYEARPFHINSEFINSLKNLPYKDGHAVLNQAVRKLGENIPPLFNAYMNISSSMQVFATANNYHFGNVEETCIMINMKDIYPTKKDRHVLTYIPKSKLGL